MDQLLKGSYPAAMRFFQRAIELDPKFASAYSGLSSANWNMGNMELYAKYSKKAFSMVGQAASEQERLLISGNYYGVTGQWDKSADMFQLYVSTYPRDATPYDSGSNDYLLTGQWDKALLADQEGARLDPRRPFRYGRLVHDHILLGARALRRGQSLCEDRTRTEP